MRRTRMLIAVCAAAAFTAPSAAEGAATAEIDCTFDGVAEVQPSIGLLGGSGWQRWQAGATCVVASATLQTATDAVMRGDGSYRHSGCTAGEWTGTFEIDFVNPQVTDHDAAYSFNFAGGPGAGLVPGRSGGGPITITPSEGNCLTPVSGFILLGRLSWAASTT